MKLLKHLAAILVLSPLFFAGCAEQAGNGKSVTIPMVSISCSSSYCRAAGTAKAYIVYTTSSCANSQFGETVAGSTTLTCNGLGCTGSITNFTSNTGSVNTIAEGYYSVCAVLDFNSSYIGSADAGDSTGGLANSFVTTGTTTRNITAFSDL